VGTVLDVTLLRRTWAADRVSYLALLAFGAAAAVGVFMLGVR